MTKAQFAAKLADKLSTKDRVVSKAEAGRIVDEITTLVTAIIKKGDKVRFPRVRKLQGLEAEGAHRAESADGRARAAFRRGRSHGSRRRRS